MENKAIELRYGDIIQIHAPQNKAIDDKLYFIRRITTKQLQLVEITEGEGEDEELQVYELQFLEGYTLSEPTIQGIDIVSRSDHLGYILQNNFTVGQYVLVKFVVGSVQARIQSIEKDCLTCVTYDTRETFYIDFAYQGLPDGIECIDAIEPPSHSIQNVGEDQGEREDQSVAAQEEDDGPDDDILDKLCTEGDDAIRNMISMEDIIEDFDEIHIRVELAENKKRYNIETQIQDIVQTLYSRLSVKEQTVDVQLEIERIVQRFTELRQATSQYEANGHISKKRAEAKPLAHILASPNAGKYNWFVPVIQPLRGVFHVSSDFVLDKPDIEERVFTSGDTWAEYDENVQQGDESKYKRMVMNLEKPPIYKTKPNDPGFVCQVGASGQQVIFSTGGLKPKLQSSAFHHDHFHTVVGSSAQFIGTQTWIPRTQKDAGFESKADTYAAQSFIIQPNLVLEHSRTKLPASTLAEKVSLNLTGQGIPAFIVPKSVPLTKEDPNCGLYHASAKTFHDCKESSEDVVPFGSKALHFYYKTGLQNKTLLNTLHTLLPDAEYYLKEYGTAHATTLPSVLNELEPLAIYAPHVQFGLYKYIRSLIGRNVRQHAADSKHNLRLLHAVFHPLKQYYKEYQPNNLQRLFLSQQGMHLLETVKSLYKLELTPTPLEYSEAIGKPTNSELVHAMYTSDYGNVLSIVLQYMHLQWALPENMYTAPHLEDAAYSKKVPRLEMCHKMLSKRYVTESSMLQDNGADHVIYFDEGRDTETPYKEIEMLNTDAGMTASTREEKIEFLKQALMAKWPDKWSDDEGVEKTATAIVDGKRKIENGHYAVLELRQVVFKEDERTFKKEKQEIVTERIYKRVQNMWRWEQNMTMAEFDTYMTLMEKTKKKGLTEDAITELEHRYSITMQEMKLMLDDELAVASHHVLRKQGWTRTLFLKQNDMLMSLSDGEKKKEAAGGSPYIALRDDILSKPTWQPLIIQFYSLYCRAAVITEDPRWTYCKETNRPLLPISFYELAQAYAHGDGVYYDTKIGEICTQYGTIDETGKYWVDEVSRLPICPIEQVSETMSSNEMFLQSKQEIVDTLLDTLVYESNVSLDQVARVILTFLMRQTGVQEDAALRTKIGLYLSKLRANNKLFLSKATYERAIQKKRAQQEPGQKVSDPPFDMYTDKTLICSMVAAFFLAVQTSIPDVRRSKGKGPVECAYSFDGYPLNSGDPEDDVGIQFMACLLYVNKTDQRPWNAVKQVDRRGLVNNIKAAMKHLLLDPVTLDIVEIKREYLSKNGKKRQSKEGKEGQSKEGKQTLEDHVWPHFLPPLVQTSIASGIQGEKEAMHLLVSDYEGQMKMTISRSGQKRHALLRLQSLLLLFTYAFVERVHAIVKGAQPRLKTNAQVPYLENACCDDLKGCTTVLSYMASKDAAIEGWTSLCKEIDARLQGVANLLFAPFLFYVDTPVFPVDVSVATTTVFNMKRALIHYLYDLKGYDDPLLRGLIMVEPLTEEYATCTTMMDKMSYFERMNRDWQPNPALFDRFMTWISSRNRIDIDARKSLESEQAVHRTAYEESLQLMQESESDTPLFDTLGQILEGDSNTGSEDEYRAKQKQWQTQFSVQRRYLQDGWRADYGLDLSVIDADAWLPDIPVQTVHQFYQNTIYGLLHMYPRSVLGSVRVLDLAYIRHWDFSFIHKGMLKDRVQEYATSFAGFKGHSAFESYLQTFLDRMAAYGDCIRQIPVSSMNGVTLTKVYSCIVVNIFQKYMDLLDEWQNNGSNDKNDTKEDNDLEDGSEGENDVSFESNLLSAQQRVYSKKDIKDRLLDYLRTCMQHETSRFKQVNVVYKQVIENARIYSEKEKLAIMKRFETINRNDIQVEQTMKKHKLGQWNVGKEVFQYNKAIFDEDIRNEGETDSWIEEQYTVKGATQRGDQGDQGDEGEEGEDQGDEGNDVSEDYENDDEEEQEEMDLEYDNDD